MNKKFSKGGLVKKPKGDDQVFELLLPGEVRISKEAFEKYGTEFFRKINEGEQLPPKLPQLQKNYRDKE